MAKLLNFYWASYHQIGYTKSIFSLFHFLIVLSLISLFVSLSSLNSMDLCAIHVKSTTHTPFLLQSSYHDHTNYIPTHHSLSFHFTKLNYLIGPPNRRANRSIVTALGKDHSRDSNSSGTTTFYSSL